MKVTQTASTRESSVPLESALRPHRLRIQGRKRQRAGSIGEAENSSSIFIKREADVTDGDRLRERRTVKRRRLQEITRSPSPTFADPDRPLPSRETEEEEAPSSLTHRNGHRERCGSPGHVTERAQYEHVGSSQSMRESDLYLMLEWVNSNSSNRQKTVPLAEQEMRLPGGEFTNNQVHY